MPEKTANYKLNQWKKEDDFLMKDFNDDNAAIEAALTGLKSTVDGKAAQSEVDTLKTTISTKANQSDLASLTSTVNTKASQSELNTLKNTVNTKANQSDLTSLTTTVNGKVGIVVGSYVGDGVNGRDINLGFQPKALLIITNEGLLGSGRSSSSTFGGLLMPGKGLYYKTHLCAEVTSTGFRLYFGSDLLANIDGYTYYYLAVK